MSVKGISVIGRNTQGVRLMRMGKGDTLVALAKIANGEEETGIPNDDDETQDQTSDTLHTPDTKERSENA